MLEKMIRNSTSAITGSSWRMLRRIRLYGFWFFVLMSAGLLTFSGAMLLLQFLYPGQVSEDKTTFFASVITFIMGKWTGLAASHLISWPRSEPGVGPSPEPSSASASPTCSTSSSLLGGRQGQPVPHQDLGQSLEP